MLLHPSLVWVPQPRTEQLQKTHLSGVAMDREAFTGLWPTQEAPGWALGVAEGLLKGVSLWELPKTSLLLEVGVHSTQPQPHYFLGWGGELSM